VVLLIGFVLEKLDCSPGPLIIAMILGPILEENMRRATLISNGDLTVFVRRPISAAFLLLAVVLIVTYLIPSFRGAGRDKVPGAAAPADPGA
jgi:TctA family transporter